MWQSTKKLVRQLMEKNDNYFSLLDEKCEELIKAKQDSNTKIDDLESLVSVLLNNQTLFIENVNQVLHAINDSVVKISNGIDELSKKISDENSTLMKDVDKLHEFGGSVQRQCVQLSCEMKENYENSSALLQDTRNGLLQSFETKTTFLQETVIANMESLVDKLEKIEKKIYDDSERKVLDNVNASLIEIKEDTDVFVKNAYIKEKVVTENLQIVNQAVQQLIANTAQLDEASRLLIAKTLLKDMEI